MKIKLNNIDIELSEEQVKEIVEKYGLKEEIEEGTEYWYVTNFGEKDCVHWRNDELDNYMYNMGNFFLNEADCDKEVERMQALARVRGYILKNKLGKEFKYEAYNFIICDYNKHIIWECCSNYNYHTILGCLISSEACEQVIGNYKDDLEIIFKIK